MTLQSASLSSALRAAQRVLEADTGDLHELAQIAGVDESRLYFRADLTGVDLRGVDIDFLLPLETDFEGAILTDQQRHAFRQESRKLVRKRMAQKIADIRIEAVTAFIEGYEANEELVWSLTSNEDMAILSPDLLRSLLLEPLLRGSKEIQLLSPAYMNSVIQGLSSWVSAENYPFYASLFKLLGVIMSEVDRDTEEVISRDYHPQFRRALGELIGGFRPTAILDRYWMTSGGMTKGISSDILKSANQLASYRKVDVVAIESCSRKLSWEVIKQLYEMVPYDCDADQAERLAHLLVSSDWPDDMTPDIIEAKFHPKVRQAVFRQVLAQGREERVAGIIRWLDDRRGAAGALSLENAFVHIKDFDLAFDLALDLSPRLAANQRAVIKNALLALASTSEERARLQRNGWR